MANCISCNYSNEYQESAYTCGKCRHEASMRDPESPVPTLVSAAMPPAHHTPLAAPNYLSGLDDFTKVLKFFGIPAGAAYTQGAADTAGWRDITYAGKTLGAMRFNPVDVSLYDVRY